MFKRIKEIREQQQKEEQARSENEIQIERQRLMSLSEKELLIETIVELKLINRTCKNNSSQCERIYRSIPND